MKIVNRIEELVVTPCLNKTESYAVRSRKLAVIAVAIIVSNGLLVGVPATIVSGLYDPSLGAYIAGAGFVQVSITTSIIPYVYLRLTRRLPDWLVDFQIWTSFPAIVFVDLFIHQGSIAILCSITVLIGVMMRVRRWQFFLLLGILGNVLHALINDYASEIPILHETFHSTQLLSVRLLYMFGSNVCPLFFFGVGLHMIMRDSVQRAEQADAAIAMNLAVADKLRRYDTDGVAEILEANQGRVDENLLTAFAAIQHNLQEYRPHIPDYVIASSLGDTTSSTLVEEYEESSDDTSDDEGDLQISGLASTVISDTNANKCSNPDMMDNSHSNNGDLQQQSAKRSIIMMPPDTSTCQNRSCSHGDGIMFTPPPMSVDEDVPTTVVEGHHGYSSPEPRDRNRNHPTSASIMSSSQQSSHNVLKFANGRHRGVKSQSAIQIPSKTACVSLVSSGDGEYHHKARQHFYGRATTVFVRFVSAPCGSDGSGNGFVSKGSAVSAMNILSKCVDAGSKLAKAHGGALQYMQGCGLMVSFNAASRSAAHESKACAFALGLKAAVDDMLDATIVMHASIVTTNVLSFFAGNSGQLMLTVLGGFMPQHTAMHHYLSQTVGKEASCVLLSDTVVPAIEMLYEHRLLGASALTSTYSDTPLFIALSQLVSSVRERGDDDKEWMYKLAQRQIKTPLERELNSIIHRIITIQHDSGEYRGDTSTGRTELIQRGTIQALLPQCDANDTVLEKCVKERLLAFTTTPTNAEDGGGFIVNASPITMW